ncbi:MAG: hypothetical protein JXQ75_02780 [Phycisphaerae bacterium]|nr:hypothetical protein [Phycisphaerae bacterium]
MSAGERVVYTIVMRRPDGTIRKTRQCFNDEGHAHELTLSCHQGLPLLSKDRSRRWLIDALDRARRKWRFELWAYVIMPEHIDALLYPVGPAYDMSAILKGIKLSVSRRAVRFLRTNAPAFLERLKVTRPGGRAEHRFWAQGGGYDRNIHSEKAAWASVEYIHMNPVRRGLCDGPTDWRWSSARWYAGLDDVVLEMDNPPG